MANGTDIAKAYVQIIPSAEGIKGKLEEIMGDEADRSGKSAGSKFGSAFGGILKAGGLAVAGFATATAAMTGALIKGSGELAEYGDHIDKMSQKMGLSATAYQEWDAILQHSGTSIDTMKAGMKTLANAVESGNGAFERIGLTMEEVAGMNNEELFAATIAGLQNVENETERTYLAGQLLGRGATELGALLNTSAEETEAMRQRVHELGGVMSDEAVKASAAYQDSLQDMRTALDGAKRGIMADFLPSITLAMDGLTELFSGGDGIGKLNEGIQAFIGKITENVPKIMEVGSRLVLSLGDAVVSNLPALLSASFGAIMTIANGLIDNLPAIIEAGLQVLVSLAQGIADNLPTLIPTIVDVVLQIVDTLTKPDTLSALIDASIAIMLALADGLIDAIPRLIEAIPDIIENLVLAITSNGPKMVETGLRLVLKLAEGIIKSVAQLAAAAPQLIVALVHGIVNQFKALLDPGARIVTSVKDGFMQKIQDAKNWGRDLIQNFINGLLEKWNNLKQTISNIAQTIKNFLGFSEPEEGPLSDFHTYAPDMMELFAKGIRDNEQVVKAQLAKSFDFGSFIEPVTIPVNPAYSGRYGAFGGYGPAYNYGGVTIVIEGRDKDAAQLARELQTELTRRTAGFDPWRQPA